MEKLNIIELLANSDYSETVFLEMIDPAGRLDMEKRKRLWKSFEAANQNLIAFYKSLEHGDAEAAYIKENMNRSFDQKVRDRILELRSGIPEKQPSDTSKIRPIDDLEGSESWGYNDDVKGK